MSNEKIENIVVANKLEKSSNHGPGARLRKAREAKGLSIEDIAKKLFLTSAVVRQIENDDYNSSQAVTFMRGYLRSYARLVDVDGAVLIAEFNELGLMDAPPLMSTQRIYHRESSVMNKVIAWATSVVGVCVVLFVVMWAHTEFSNNDTSVSNVASNIASTVTSAVTANRTSSANSVNQASSTANMNTEASNGTGTNSVASVTGNSQNTELANNQSSSTIISGATSDATDSTVNNTNASASMDSNMPTTMSATSTDTTNVPNKNVTEKDKQKIAAENSKKNRQLTSSSITNGDNYTAQNKSKKLEEKKQKISIPF